MRESQIRFIRQQGFATEAADQQLYSALMLQPKIVGVIVVLGIVVQSPLPFLVLSAALGWSAVVPAHSPFDRIYNNAIAHRRGPSPLAAAPPPRRFAAGLAGIVAGAIGIALLTGAAMTAWILEGLLALAVIQIVFRDECAGANLYHLLQRRRANPANSHF